MAFEVTKAQSKPRLYYSIVPIIWTRRQELKYCSIFHGSSRFNSVFTKVLVRVAFYCFTLDVILTSRYSPKIIHKLPHRLGDLSGKKLVMLVSSLTRISRPIKC